MHRYLTLTLIASTVTAFAKPPAIAHPVQGEKIAKVTSPADAKKAAPPTAVAPAPEKADAPKDKQAVETARLAKESALIAERSKRATAELRATVDKLKLEKEHLTEKLALEAIQRKSSGLKERRKFEIAQEKLTRESTLAKARAEKLANEMKAKQVEWAMETSRLEAEIKTLEVNKKRDNYADTAPSQLKNPVLKDGTLVISDRRITLNGAIVSRTADHVSTRLNYFNNKDTKLPIFIVIDSSPGGSVMSGYRILKAMEGSRAPIYVVVKSFAASMAATIATLAERSYAYPNAVILHHQMSSTLMFANLNITEQKEMYEESQKWWARLAGPVAKKMGISTDEFIKQMYENSSSGDWSEFADEAKRLKWIDHIVTAIHETSLVENPDAKKAATAPAGPRSEYGMMEQVDDDGRPFVYLPRTNPRDYYFMYNPDNYYRSR